MRLVLTALVLATAAPPAPGAESGEEAFLSRVRRLTFEGRRAGEGYFSPDGGVMVFQSEREPGNPFYQIYRMDLSTGDTQRISPGHGKTTCAFVRPGTGDVVFASTHHDPRSEELQEAELELRASGRERRYSWDYDPEMELWVWKQDGGDLVRLTRVRGYDAEASYSPDGEWIVFSSLRAAYGRKLDEREQRLLEVNPAYFGDLYVMRADGSEPRQLTFAPGYDGGPFFFPDGSRIVWRRFDEEGLIADIWTARPDGSDALQVTDFGSMSWAPYVHASGAYILFASNVLGFENFEIYMVDVRGEKQPVRVTHSEGFDGLPVPSPDGTRLSFTSSRAGGRAGQIYLADWNHEAARAALAAAPARE